MKTAETVPVWDIFVRVFHWFLVLLVLLAFLTGDDARSLHFFFGYAILVLIGLRLVWGLIGTRHARFASFITPPREAWSYLKGLLTGRSRHYLGHNPAAAWMVVALLLILLLVNGSGHLAKPDQPQGYAKALKQVSLVTPAYADDDFGGEGESGGFIGEIHEALAGLLIGLIGLHVCGALLSSLLHRENLVAAMVHGRKIKRE